MSNQPPDITQYLERWGAGDPRALQQVIPLVYAQLRAIAQSQMNRERGDHTLSATALVSELYLRLAAQHGGQWKDRAHFFAFAALMMRRILTDYARQAHTGKRGGHLERVPLSDELPWLGNSREEILSLDHALDRLEQSDPRKVRVLEMRVLLGCTAAESAEILEISKSTADREWTLAKAWLFRELSGSGVLQAPGSLGA